MIKTPFTTLFSPVLAASLCVLPTLPCQAQMQGDTEMSSEMQEERKKALAKKLTRGELSDAKEEYEADMDRYREITAILKKIRADDDVTTGRDALKRLMPDSTETYDRMANRYKDNDNDEDEDEDEDDSSLTVEEVRAKRAYDQIKSKDQKAYDKLMTSLEEEIERILDSDLQSYELMQMLERLEDEL